MYFEMFVAQLREKHVRCAVAYFAVILLIVVGFMVASLVTQEVPWWPFVVIPVLLIPLVVYALSNARKKARAVSRVTPHFATTLSNLGKHQPVGQPGQQGLDRFSSLAWLHVPGQEWNLRHGMYRDRFFATFSFFGNMGMGSRDQYEEFHVAYIEARRHLPTLHVSRSRDKLPLDLRLSKQVTIESRAFNDRWIAYTRDPWAASAVLIPSVIDVLSRSRLDARAWVFDNGAVAMVATDEIEPSHVVGVLNELHTLADALADGAPQET